MYKIDRFKGLGVAIVTPFLQNGEIDIESLENLVEDLIKNNVDYLVALGTTGETPALTRDEKSLVVRTVVKATKNRVPIVVGMGGPATSKLLNQFKTFDFSGVSAILSVTPYYNRPTQEGLCEHYKELAYHTPLPIILYNVPIRTGCNLETDTILKLAELENIIGVKEASGNMNQIMKIINNKPKDFLVISGDDAITLPLMAVGIDGLISVVANAFPDEMATIIHSAQQNDFETAREMQMKMLEIIQACFKEGSPAGVKTFLTIQGKIEYYLRLPLTRVSDAHQNHIKQLIMNYEL